MFFNSIKPFSRAAYLAKRILTVGAILGNLADAGLNLGNSGVPVTRSVIWTFARFVESSLDNNLGILSTHPREISVFKLHGSEISPPACERAISLVGPLCCPSSSYGTSFLSLLFARRQPFFSQ